MRSWCYHDELSFRRPFALLASSFRTRAAIQAEVLALRPALAVATYMLPFMIVHHRGRGLTIGLTSLVFVLCIAGPLCRALRKDAASSVCGVLVVGSYWTFSFFLASRKSRRSPQFPSALGILKRQSKNSAISQGSQPDHLHLIWFLCGGARFRVRDERVEVRVTVKRFKVRVFIYAESVTWRQTVIHGLA